MAGRSQHHLWPPPQASFSLEVQVWAQTRGSAGPSWGAPAPVCCPTLRLLGRFQIFWSKLEGACPAFSRTF